MADPDTPQPLPQAGEPGTFAVTAAEPERTPHVTYHPDQSGAPPKLRVHDLSVTYIDRRGNRTEAVRDVSFDVYDKPDSGEIVVFLGPSGCGKSTILKAVAGLLPPTKGEILVDGKPVTDVGRDRGMVFQAYTSFGWLTVRENVEYGLKLQGVDEGQAARDFGQDSTGGGAGGVRRALSERPLGRHEAARGDCAHAGQQPAGRPDGRALRRARPADALGDAEPSARRVARREQHHPLRHARRVRGGLPGRHHLRPLASARRRYSIRWTRPPSPSTTSRSSPRPSSAPSRKSCST